MAGLWRAAWCVWLHLVVALLGLGVVVHAAAREGPDLVDWWRPGVQLFLLASVVALALVSSAAAAASAVPLGNADSFAVLAGADHEHRPDDRQRRPRDLSDHDHRRNLVD